MINEHGRTRVEANVTVKSTFSSALFALNVIVTVPVPSNTSKANIMVSAYLTLFMVCITKQLREKRKHAWTRQVE